MINQTATRCKSKLNKPNAPPPCTKNIYAQLIDLMYNTYLLSYCAREAFSLKTIAHVALNSASLMVFAKLLISFADPRESENEFADSTVRTKVLFRRIALAHSAVPKLEA